MKKLSGGCTLDCFDACKFNVYVDDKKVVKIEGDKNHPYTKGFICKKGFAHLERHHHEKRQYKPLLKVNNEWQEISFAKALEIMAEKLSFYKESYESESVLYYEQYGSGSILKSIGDIFFNFFGGCSKQKGGPCWSAGIKAQESNFGDVRSHSLEDMMNSKTIIVWGKNPAYTTIHTMQSIRQAQKNGSFIIVIDPIETATAKQADLYVRVKADGDTALALAMAKRIIEKKKYDEEYIKKYVQSFEEFYDYVKSLDLEKLCEKCGVSIEMIDFLVEKYTEKYSTILLGYGLQKYKFGGNTIHLIDTLAAITGQIGERGAGVNYANKVYPGMIDGDPYKSEKYSNNKVFFVSRISEYIEKNNIKMAVIIKSNLLNQLPALKRLEKSLSKIEFKVCFDQFLTDTAAGCDLFIPTTDVFESEDLLFSSMTNPYLTYIEKAVEPEHKLMDEYEFFKALAEKLELKNYPLVEKHEYLSKVIEPLKKYNEKISLEYLKDNYFTIHKDVAWEDKCFKTTSGKFEIIFNEKASLEEVKQDNKFRLLTNHSKDSLFSQHFMDKDEMSIGYINEKMAKKTKVEEGEEVTLKSEEGSIKVKIKIDNSIGDYLIMMYVGWWKSSGNPNFVLSSGISDIGGQVTYNDNWVEIKKKKN